MKNQMNTPLPVMFKLIPNHKVWNMKNINEKYEINTGNKYAIPVNEQKINYDCTIFKQEIKWWIKT